MSRSLRLLGADAVWTIGFAFSTLVLLARFGGTTAAIGAAAFGLYSWRLASRRDTQTMRWVLCAVSALAAAITFGAVGATVFPGMAKDIEAFSAANGLRLLAVAAGVAGVRFLLFSVESIWARAREVDR